MLLSSADASGVTFDTRPLVWPDARTMFANAFELDWKRRVKYAWRLVLTWNVRDRLLRECAGMSFADALFRKEPRAFYPVMNHLVDRRLGAKARLCTTLASLRTVCGAMGDPADVQRLLTQGVTLAELADGTRIVLSLNGVSFHEGLWQVGLISAAGVRIYSIGFGFTDERSLSMSNVQGPSLGNDGQALIRDVTHAAHGMRPAHLLVHTLRVLAGQWGVSTLKGIDPSNHVKGRWNLRDSRLRFDYRGFWQEHGAARGDDGNWALPLETAVRPLEEVAAKRRAMYRRRHAMFDVLQLSVSNLSKPRPIESAPTAIYAPSPAMLQPA
jgi:uncharacterized protein VirK/YbjX